MKYNHWFWNSKAVDCIAHATVKFSGWLWGKQYDRRS